MRASKSASSARSNSRIAVARLGGRGPPRAYRESGASRSRRCRRRTERTTTLGRMPSTALPRTSRSRCRQVAAQTWLRTPGRARGVAGRPTKSATTISDNSSRRSQRSAWRSNVRRQVARRRRTGTTRTRPHCKIVTMTVRRRPSGARPRRDDAVYHGCPAAPGKSWVIANPGIQRSHVIATVFTSGTRVSLLASRGVGNGYRCHYGADSIT
jgi:hypothetical protein